MVAAGEALAPSGDRCDAVLVDIDHSPRRLLHPSHAPFYTPAGLQRLAVQLTPDGVFALWSDDPPDPGFVANIESVFASCDAHVVAFPNPYTDNESSAIVYVATGPPAPGARTRLGSGIMPRGSRRP